MRIGAPIRLKAVLGSEGSMHPFRCAVCNRLTIPSNRFIFYTKPVCINCLVIEGEWTTK